MLSFKNNKTIKYALRKTSVAFGSVAVATMIATAGIATVSADEVSSADTVTIPAAAITVATATEPKATEVFLKAYLIVLLFFNDDMTIPSFILNLKCSQA